MGKSIRVFAPASVSNVGPGFDIMGFALLEPGDEIKLTLRKDNRIVINKITGDSGKLPFDVDKNTASVAIKTFLKKQNITAGLNIEIHKKMGIGSGLGSSAASSVGAVFALNKLLGTNLTKSKLLEFAIAGEQIASGAVHADNVAPCLFGGFILVRSYNPIDIIHPKIKRNLYCSIVYPKLEIKTCEARKILDKKIDLKLAVSQAGNAASLILGLTTGDIKLIGRSLVDNIAEPKRAKLIPFYDAIREAAFNAGAINCNITGSGPSMFAFSEDIECANQIAQAMGTAVKKAGLKYKTYISKINKVGPYIID